MMNPESVEKKPEKKFTVLLVDDNKDLLDTLGENLISDYTVILATSSADALKAGKFDQPIDAAVCDYMLPTLDGIEILRRLRRDDPWIASILISGHLNLNLAIRAINSGAVDRILPKPFSPADLQKSLKDVLDQREIKRQSTGKTSR